MEFIALEVDGREFGIADLDPGFVGVLVKRGFHSQSLVGGDTARNSREVKGWSEAVLNRKLDRLAWVISRMNDGAGPDILGVCEVENRYVLQRLAELLASTGRRYDIVYADTQDQRGIDVALCTTRTCSR